MSELTPIQKYQRRIRELEAERDTFAVLASKLALASMGLSNLYWHPAAKKHLPTPTMFANQADAAWEKMSEAQQAGCVEGERVSYSLLHKAYNISCRVEKEREILDKVLEGTNKTTD